MSKFKAGDKVVRIGGGDDEFMMRGRTYVIKEMSNGWIKPEGSEHTYDPSYFSLLEDNTKVAQTSTPQLQNMKFRVENEEHSRLIQTELFKLGYSWVDGMVCSYLNEKFLFTYSCGSLSHSSSSKIYFDTHENTEYKFEAITTYNLVRVEPEYIEYNGVKYLKEEFEEAINKLTAY